MYWYVVQIYTYIYIYIYWCTKWNSILHGMTRQNNSLPPKCRFPGDIAACFACISRICSGKMGCGSVGTRNSQIWHHVLNVVSFFKCSDIYFDQSNKLWKKHRERKGSLFFVRIWLLYSWKDVPERVENCKQYIIFLYRSSDDSYYRWGVKFALQATGLFFWASKCIIPWSICSNYSLQMAGVVTVHAFLVFEQSPFCHIYYAFSWKIRVYISNT